MRSDVTFVVEKQRFRVHRPLLWARSLWFRALMAERWAKGAEIEVTGMTADVFGSLAEFLYTGCAGSLH